jgi:CRISPR-associated Csx2 family protein
VSSTSLITFLGGTRGKDQHNKAVYQQTPYEFPNGAIATTDYFAEALRQQEDFQEILIFGTKTSIWEKLAEDAGDLELALTVLEKTDESAGGSGIDHDLLYRVQDKLSECWGKKVVLHAGEKSITAENAQQELLRYVGVLEQIEGEEILLDFTHGFRSMPMLLNSAIEFWQAMQPVQTPLRLVYGEFNRQGNSSVHYLDDISQSQKAAQSVKLFFEKFDGTELANLVTEFWPSGRKALIAFTRKIQENRLNEIEDPLRQLRNALNNMANLQGAPPWFQPVHQRLGGWIKSVLQSKLPQTLASLAAELAGNRLYAQAIMALDEALLEAILIANKQTSRELSFEERNELFRQTVSGVDKNFKEQFWKLHNLRNFVAHSGRKDISQVQRPVGSPAEQFWKLHVFLKPVLSNPEHYLSEANQANSSSP